MKLYNLCTLDAKSNPPTFRHTMHYTIVARDINASSHLTPLFHDIDSPHAAAIYCSPSRSRVNISLHFESEYDMLTIALLISAMPGYKRIDN